MSHDLQREPVPYVAKYLRRVLQGKTAGEVAAGPGPVRVRGAGHIGPTFWADTPWRLEPDQDEIPFTFVVRDGDRPNVSMELDKISVYEAPDDGTPWEDKTWSLVRQFTDSLGAITKKYWTYRPAPSVPLGPPPTIPLSSFATPAPGGRLALKIAFEGSRMTPLQGRQEFEEWKPLSILLATDSLPLRESAQWHYGDTHYHSNYTNDLKEFGNPVPDTRAAAECIGLDWLVITDHSVDLADNNPYWEDKLTSTRWGDQGIEVQASSDERVRILRGEELTLAGMPGKGDDLLHMLVMGAGFDKLIPGAFAKKGLLATVASFLLGFAKDLYEHLFGPVYKLEAVLTGVNQSGQAEPALLERSVQAQGVLAFAAHPASMAQAPGGVWEFYDLVQPIHGVEAWNGGMRYHTGRQESPFDHWEKAKDWDEGASKKAIDNWDKILRQKVGYDDPRHILLGGSDAHGSFNYSEGWWVDWDGFRADDNALGKVRTLLYLPHRDADGPRQAPTEAEVADALRTGSCMATDGPVLNLAIGFNGSRATLGQILTVNGDGALDVAVQAASTAEFGEIERVELIHYFQGMAEPASTEVDFSVGNSQIISDTLPTGSGYVRLETVTRNGSETYRCFTNPIWIRSAGPGRRALRVSCVA